MSEMISNLLKASDFTRSFLKDIKDNLPIVFASLATTIFLSFVPERFLPSALRDLQGTFKAFGIFILVYIIALWWFQSRSIRQSKFWLHHLAKDEKVILREFLKQNKSVADFSIDDGAAFNLVNKGILSIAVNYFAARSVPIAIQPFVFEILSKKPQLIDLQPSEIGSEELKKRMADFPDKSLKPR